MTLLETSFRAVIVHALRAALLPSILLIAGCSSGDEHPTPELRESLLREAIDQSAHGELLAAVQMYRRIVGIDGELQLQDRKADDDLTLGRLEASIGYLEQAIGHDMEAWESFRGSGRRGQEIAVMTELGLLYYQLGMEDEAVPLFTDALTIAKLFNDDASQAVVSCALGDACVAQRRYEKAIEHYNEALRIAERHGEAAGIIRYQSRIGLAWAEAGNAAKSASAFEQARELAATPGNAYDPARISFDEGRALEVIGAWPEAARSFETGRAQSSTSTTPAAVPLRAGLAAGLGEIYAHDFAFTPAKEEFKDAFTLLRDAGERRPLAYLLMAIGDCSVRLGATNRRPDAIAEATGYFAEAAGLLNKVGDPYGESLALVKLALTNEQQGSTDAALNLYRRAFELVDGTQSVPSVPLEDDPLGVILGLPWHRELSGLGPSFWFEPFVSLLSRTNRSGEALWYYERARSRSAWRSLQAFSFEPLDDALRGDIDSYRRQLRAVELQEGERLVRRSQENRNRDSRDIDGLDLALDGSRQSLQATATVLEQRHPLMQLLFKPPSLSLDALQSAIPGGTAVADYFLTGDRLLIFFIDASGPSGSVRSQVFQVPVYRDVLLEKLRLYRSMLDRRVRRSFSSSDGMVTLDGLGAELYGYLVQPIESVLPAHLIVIPDDAMTGLPFHALASDATTPLLERVDVSYLPSLDAILDPAPPRSIGSVLAAGNPTGKEWSLEFELRDIRSFFRQADIILAQNVTAERIEAARSDLLQLSTDFTTDTIDESRSTFILSNGSISTAGVPVAVSDLIRFPSFPIVYLSDQHQEKSGLSVPFARMMMMNGTAGIIMNLFATDTRTNKLFSERFYAALGSGENPHDAYRSAALALRRTPSSSPTYVWSSYFYYGK